MGISDILKHVDQTVGGLLCAGLRLFRRRASSVIDPLQIRRVLIVKWVGIGDWVLILPMLRALRSRYPHIEVDALVSPRVRDIVEGEPDISRIFYFDPLRFSWGVFRKLIGNLRGVSYDVILDLEHYQRFSTSIALLAKPRFLVGFDLKLWGKSSAYDYRTPYRTDRHEAFNFLEALSVFGIVPPVEISLVPLALSESDIRTAAAFMSAHSLTPGGFILLHPGTGATASARRWPLPYWKRLIDRLLAEQALPIVVTGGPEEYGFQSEFASHPRLIWAIQIFGLKAFAALCRHTKAYIGLDTGPTHVAAAMGSPVAALYGPNTPLRWGPVGGHVRTVYTPPICSPCIRQYEGPVTTCQRPICMALISIEEVFQAVRKLCSIETAHL